MSKETVSINSKYSRYFGYFESISFKSRVCWLCLLIIGITLELGQRSLTLRIEKFLTLSAEIEGDDLNEFTTYLEGMEINVNVTDEEVERYHNEGYLLIRKYYNSAGVEAMRFIVDFVNRNPSVFYQLSKTPQRRFCGFFIHPFFLIPAFRRWLRKILESGMSTIASKLLLSNERPVEIGSILHSTLRECFSESEQMKVRGNTHSDQNQGVYSIERKRTIGDNMLVTWTALDRLDKETISLEVWPKSHKWQDEQYGSRFNESKYCTIYTDMMNNTLNGAAHPTLPSVSLTLNPGDVLFFQGFTFHRITKSSACSAKTCRRITTRYVRGEDTAWRNHVLETTTWPFASWIPRTDGLLVKDTSGEFDMGEARFTEEAMSKPPMIPRASSWLKFWFDSKLRGGMKPEQFVNLCKQAEVNLDIHA